MKKIKKVFINSMIKVCKSPKKRAKLISKHSDVNIGKNCEIFSEVNFGSEPYLIEIGDRVRISKGVHLTTHDGGVWVLRNMGLAKNADLFGRIKIGNNVHIGLNSIVMPGVTIGNNVIIGAGAKNVESNSIVAGVPARKVKDILEYFEANKEEFYNTKDLNAEDKKRTLLNDSNI